MMYTFILVEFGEIRLDGGNSKAALGISRLRV